MKTFIQQPGVLASFEYLDEFSRVLKELPEKKDCKGYEVFSFTSYHGLMDIAEAQYGPSEVRWFTLTGALLGVTTGFGMPLLLDYDWPLVVGGKTPGIYSLPAYFIFGFELMILFGAIATILGMLVMGRLPDSKRKVLHKKATDDRFVVFVPGAGTNGEQWKYLESRGGVCEAYNP